MLSDEEESAIPEDKRQEAIDRMENDWAHDPINPRNWSTAKKWGTVGLVRISSFGYTFSGLTIE